MPARVRPYGPDARHRAYRRNLRGWRRKGDAVDGQLQVAVDPRVRDPRTKGAFEGGVFTRDAPHLIASGGRIQLRAQPRVRFVPLQFGKERGALQLDDEADMIRASRSGVPHAVVRCRRIYLRRAGS